MFGLATPLFVVLFADHFCKRFFRYYETVRISIEHTDRKTKFSKRVKRRLNTAGVGHRMCTFKAKAFHTWTTLAQARTLSKRWLVNSLSNTKYSFLARRLYKLHSPQNCYCVKLNHVEARNWAANASGPSWLRAWFSLLAHNYLR